MLGRLAQGWTTPSPENRIAYGLGLKESDYMTRYRLRTTTVGLHQGATRSAAIWIPADSVLRVAADFVHTAGFVEVEWDGKSVQIFAVDLVERGELVRAASGKGGAR